MAKSFINKKSITMFSKLIILISFEFICMTIMAFGIQDKTTYVLYAIGFAAVLLGCTCFLPETISKTKEQVVFIILLALCFVIKIMAANVFHPTPVADYKTFYDTAQSLSESYYYTVNPLYIALFPHVFGYSEVLSAFFRMFGAAVGVAVNLNVVLSVLSMACLYQIGKVLRGFPMAVVCSILWIFFPSQSFWNSFVLSEPLYTTELLMFWCLILMMEKYQSNKKKAVSLAVAAGLMLVLFQMSRTVGAIVIIAMFLTAFLVKIASMNTKKAVLVFLTVVVFLVGNRLAEYHVESRIGTATGGFSWYHVCVGMEESTGGKWNEEDWNRVLGNVNYFQQNGYKKPAVEAQKVERKEAERKVRNLSKPLELLRTKMKILLGNDSSGIIIHLKYSDVSLKEKTCEQIEFLTNSFYYMLVLLSIFAGFLFFREKEGDISFIFLYTIGLTMGHMLIEVQERYHYSILLGFLVGAAYTVSVVASFSKAESF